MISSATLITACPDAVACELEGGRALLDLRSGNYFSLNDTGSFVWSQLDAPKSYDHIFQAMLNHYDIDAATLDTDLKTLMTRLVEQELVQAEG